MFPCIDYPCFNREVQVPRLHRHHKFQLYVDFIHLLDKEYG